MPAGDDGTIFRGNAFVDIDENGDILISPESGQQVTFEGENFDGQGTSEFQNLQSVGTESLTKGGYQDDEAVQLLGYISDAGESVSTTVSIGKDTLDDGVIFIEVFKYRDNEDAANNNLELLFGGVGAGEYSYAVEDESLSATRRTGQDAFALLEPTASGNFDAAAGRWIILGAEFDDPRVFGRGVFHNLEQGNSLAKGTAGGGSFNNPFGLTLQASASAGESVSLEAAILRTRQRGGI